MRRRALALGTALLSVAVLDGSSLALAQEAVVCTNCSTEASSLTSLAKQALQYGKQLQQLATELQMYETMVTNTVDLPMQVWGTVQSDIMQVQSLANMSSLLSGNAGSLISRLQSANGYVNQATSLANVGGQFTTWQQTIGNNLSSMGKMLGLQRSQEADNAAMLQALQQHSQSAVGQMQAIQAGNELASATVGQLQQMEATLTATAQMQATQIGVDADRRAAQDQATMKFLNAPAMSTSDGSTF